MQPAPLPYSPTRRSGNLLFTAGQIGWDPATGIAKPGIEEQTHQAMKNLIGHLENSSSSLADVIKITIFLTNMGDYAKCNEVYATYVSEPYPARTCVAVKELPRVSDVDLVIEIEAIAEIK
ncbi:MAG TPA: Rid family detoxifying hydrolase [Acidimicrobiia bacterium]|jgi:2-iminobutanoate/2-iminopropanoate deaminase|nr:Rid family detoxifying hydrolase [Acidimicrobiia bacterium]